MKIQGVNGINAQSGSVGMSKAEDSVTKNIKQQISNAQKQLQELSANKDMTVEEKMNKRQDIQKQINDLNNQLRQHEMEQRRGKQQAKGSVVEDLLGGNRKSRSQGTGLSQSSMRAMISADSAMNQAQVQGSVATKMEGKAGVLKAEIKQDAALGGNTEAKEEELATVSEIALNATASQVNTLAEANKEIEEAAKADQTTKNVDSKDKEIKSEKIDSSETLDLSETIDKAEKANKKGMTETSSVPQQPVINVSVDIRL